MPVNDLYAGTTRPSQCVPSFLEKPNKNRTRRVGSVFGMRASLVRPLPTGLQLGSRTPGVAALAESDEDRTLRYTLRLEPASCTATHGDAYATRGSFVLLPCVRPAPLTPDRPPAPPPSMACGVAWRNGVTSASTCYMRTCWYAVLILRVHTTRHSAGLSPPALACRRHHAGREYRLPRSGSVACPSSCHDPPGRWPPRRVSSAAPDPAKKTCCRSGPSCHAANGDDEYGTAGHRQRWRHAHRGSVMGAAERARPRANCGQLTRENPASRGSEASADVLVVSCRNLLYRCADTLGASYRVRWKCPIDWPGAGPHP